MEKLSLKEFLDRGDEKQSCDRAGFIIQQWEDSLVSKQMVSKPSQTEAEREKPGSIPAFWHRGLHVRPGPHISPRQLSLYLAPGPPLSL